MSAVSGSSVADSQIGRRRVSPTGCVMNIQEPIAHSGKMATAGVMLHCPPSPQSGAPATNMFVAMVWRLGPKGWCGDGAFCDLPAKK